MNKKGVAGLTVSLIAVLAIFVLSVVGGTGLTLGIFRGLKSIPQLVWWGIGIFMVIFLLKRVRSK